MFPYLFLLFILMPIVEIALLIQIGSSIGLLSTLLIIVATAVIGTIMLRQQGMATLNKAQTRLAAGEMPAQQLSEGLLLLVGGVLLLTPGFVTDAFGFVCLVPFTRQWMAKAIARRSMAGVWSGAVGGPGSRGGAAGPASPRASARPASRPGESDVIEGSYSREED